MFAARKLAIGVPWHSTISLVGPSERISYRDAFLQHAAIDPHTADDGELIEAIRRHCRAASSLSNTLDRDSRLDLLLAEQVAPHLGRERPAILYDYPASQAALAKVRDDDPPVAERFELFVDGIELANGYHELTDADELKQRIEKNNQQRAIDGKNRLPNHSRLLTAMEHGLPECTGVALGFDRLALIAIGVDSIYQVLAFPFDRA